MKKVNNLITILLFAGFLAVIVLGSALAQDRSFSENENRVLSQLPEATAETVFSGSFESDFQSYMDDQIVGRDQWITLKSAAKRATLAKDINGVYLGKDGYLIEKRTEEEVDHRQFTKNLQAVREFFAGLPEKIQTSAILVPSKGAILTDKLPAAAPLFDEASCRAEAEQVLGDYGYVDLYQAFSGSTHKDSLYYKTDHHWSGRGALLAYSLWQQSLGRESKAEKQELQVLSEDFLGTLYAKVLWDSGARDIVEAPEDDQVKNWTVTADGKRLAGVYIKEYLSKRDKYAVFFGGNYGKVSIETGSHTGRNLLVVKDSFANSFVPYGGADYDRICMVDLRYFSGNLQEYMEENQITEVLLLYSIETFLGDKNLSALNLQGNILS